MTQSYTGHLPYTDEGQERVDNAEHLQTGTFGAKQVVLYDSAGNEISSGAGTSITDGTKTVTTAGTAVQISAASVPCKGVIVNADIVVGIVCAVGASTVVANVSGQRGVILIPGNDPVFIPVSNLNLLYVDSQTNGGKISYLVIT